MELTDKEIALLDEGLDLLAHDVYDDPKLTSKQRDAKMKQVEKLEKKLGTRII